MNNVHAFFLHLLFVKLSANLFELSITRFGALLLFVTHFEAQGVQVSKNEKQLGFFMGQEFQFLYKNTF